MSDNDAQTLGPAGARPASTTMLILSQDQCWAHLRAGKLGRLAIVFEGRPLIFPVNYAVDQESIVFRTGPGTKLEHGPGSVACFEIDGYDEHSREGWSVIASGTLEEVTDAVDSRSVALRKLHVEPLAPGVRLHWIALQAEEVTGRHFTAGWMVPGAYLG
jgi:uncharacterized protein